MAFAGEHLEVSFGPRLEDALYHATVRSYRCSVDHVGTGARNERDDRGDLRRCLEPLEQ
jgi:hypothetical protein